MSALLAVLVLSALAASSASAALPEFIPRKGVKFTSSKGTLLIQKEGVPYANCPNGSITGEIVGAKEIRAHLKYEYGETCGLFCENLRPTFESRELKGTLGYITKAKREVGIHFAPVEEPFAKCEHAGYFGTLTGSFVSQIEGVNKRRTGPFELTLSTTPLRLEGEEKTPSLFREKSEFSYIGKLSLTFAEAIEIEA
jgi:hypothetical protein